MSVYGLRQFPSSPYKPHVECEYLDTWLFGIIVQNFTFEYHCKCFSLFSFSCMCSFFQFPCRFTHTWQYQELQLLLENILSIVMNRLKAYLQFQTSWVGGNEMEGLKLWGDLETSSHDVTKATTHCIVLSRPNSDPYILHMLQRLLLTVVFIWKVQSTLVDLWLLKKGGFIVSLPVEGSQGCSILFFSFILSRVEAKFCWRQDHYSSSFHTAHSQVYFHRAILNTCTCQSTLLFCFHLESTH